MKILIAYSSGMGSTEQVSQEIAKIIAEDSIFNVDVQSIDSIHDIHKYDSVIIGSSVRADRPLANVRDFFATYRQELSKKKVALFAVCLLANCADGREKVKREYLSQILDKYPELKPVAVEAFGGSIDFDKLNPVMQSLMYRVLEKTGIPAKGSVDTRDWNFIRAWASEVREKLKNDGNKIRGN
jgi:menaquinone-dependent protoporphyrinogen IX oxidase